MLNVPTWRLQRGGRFIPRKMEPNDSEKKKRGDGAAEKTNESERKYDRRRRERIWEKKKKKEKDFSFSSFSLSDFFQIFFFLSILLFPSSSLFLFLYKRS